MDVKSLVWVLAASSHVAIASCQQLWTGPPVAFSKADSVDWTKAENQDRITDRVWITRANRAGFFNIKQEEQYNHTAKDSPVGTRWAIGKLADGIENLEFTTWFETLVDPPPDQIGLHKVMHLVEEDIYIDVLITAWSGGAGGSGQGFGGGFSYERSTDPSLTSLQVEEARSLHVFPNPSSRHLFIIGLERESDYLIVRESGEIVQTGKTSMHEKILVHSLPPGVYRILLGDGRSTRFVLVK